MKEIDTLLLKFVSGVELFREMDVDSVSALLRQASSMSFVPGDLVFEVFRTSGGKHVCIAKVESGQHFGEIALVPSVAIRLSKAAVMSEQKAAVLLFRNMAQMLAKCLITLDEEVILHKRAAIEAAEAAPAPEPERARTYTVMRRA